MLETPCVGLRGWGRTGRCYPRVPRQPSQLLALVWQQGAQRDVPVPGVTPGRLRRGTCASSERGPMPVPCARSSARHGHSFTVLASRERRAPPRLQRCTPTSRRPPPCTHMHVASLTTEGPLRLQERSTFSKAGPSRGRGCQGRLHARHRHTAKAGEAFLPQPRTRAPPPGPVVLPPVPPEQVSLGTGMHTSLRAEGARGGPEVPGSRKLRVGPRELHAPQRPVPAAPRPAGPRGSGVTRTAALSTETQLAPCWRCSPWARRTLR